MGDAVAACNSVFGMSVELATFLSALRTVFTGNPLSLNPSYSIFKSSPLVSNVLGNVLRLAGMTPSNRPFLRLAHKPARYASRPCRLTQPH
jgi:hypothetical protein